MTTGRPTLYTPEILKLANSYIDDFIPSKEEPVPMICGLALHLGLSRETVYDWSKQEEKKEFSDIVCKVMTKQEQLLFAGGLSGDFNSSITKLALTKHNYSDRQETSGLNGGPIEVDHNLIIEFVEPGSD